MATDDISTTIEDHALERVPEEDRKNWVWITWNTTGLITTLVMLFFGALVCFVAGVKIALLCGLASFTIAMPLAWLLAHIAYETGLSNTLITRQYGLGVRGSALASVIFASFIIGFLALENALLYRGFLFFFELGDTILNQVLIYGGLTLTWVLVTTFGFVLVTRFSSLMIIAFLITLVAVIAIIIGESDYAASEVFVFTSQLPPQALADMGIHNDLDKFIFGLNILIGPAAGLSLNSADFGRYGKSTAHVGTGVTIGVFCQSLVMMLIGGVLMYAGAEAMVAYYQSTAGLSVEAAHDRVLRSPDSIAATFMVFGGAVGFILMFVAQAKAQVLNTYSSSLCLANLFDAISNWRPGRFFFVILANIIAMIMVYGHILELVEHWISMLGVMLSAISGVIILDYYLVRPKLTRSGYDPGTNAAVNWAGLITIVIAIIAAHYVLKPYIRIEVLGSLLCVAVLYPLLRLTIFRPKQPTTHQ